MALNIIKVITQRAENNIKIIIKTISILFQYKLSLFTYLELYVPDSFYFIEINCLLAI